MPDVQAPETSLKAATAYLKLDGEGQPYLEGSKCGQCSQVLLGARENCPRCGARKQMQAVRLATKGRLYNYTIVYRSYPGITVPFISAIVDLDGGGTVKGNLLDIEPDPAKLKFDMPVEVVFRGAELANPEGKGFVSHFFIPAMEAA